MRMISARSASVNLNTSLPSATPSPCTPAATLKSISEREALLVHPPVLEERGDENGDHALDDGRTHGFSFFAVGYSKWNISSTGYCTGEKSGLVSM